MLVPAGTMGVAVCLFVVSSVSDINYLDFETQIHAGERMIGINIDIEFSITDYPKHNKKKVSMVMLDPMYSIRKEELDEYPQVYYATGAKMMTFRAVSIVILVATLNTIIF